MSNRLETYGVVATPTSPISVILVGALNAWSYNHKDPLNQLRDRSIQLRNLCDDALGKFTDQLKQELSQLRKRLPQPTRENPYPPMDGLEAVKELDAYIRDVESLRVRVRSAAVPPHEFIHHSKEANLELLSQLELVDREILSTLSSLSAESVQLVKTQIDRRDSILTQF